MEIFNRFNILHLDNFPREKFVSFLDLDYILINSEIIDDIWYVVRFVTSGFKYLLSV